MPVGKQPEQIAQFVGFQLGGRGYAVDIQRIVEIIYNRAATPLPEAPDYVEGVVDLRGVIIPVVDLKKILRLSVAEKDKPAHILIVRMRKRRIGLIVDSVQEVLRINTSKIQSPQTALGNEAPQFVKGVYKDDGRLFIILSVGNLLTIDDAKRMGLES